MGCDAIPECRDEEEVRKKILAALRGGQPAILFDNIRGQFGSSAIEAMLTAQVYNDRMLGSTRMLSLPTMARCCSPETIFGRRAISGVVC